jgi:hypothetical protein
MTGLEPKESDEYRVGRDQSSFNPTLLVHYIRKK